MALKQSHVNHLHKIIAAAEKLLTEIEREMESQAGGGGGRGGRRGTNGSGRGRSVGKTQGRGTRGRSIGRKSANSKTARGNAGTRRTRAQTAEFRQTILRELEGGTPVADLAAKHGITPAYVYQIKSRAAS